MLINSNSVNNFVMADLLYEIHVILEKISLFKVKYGLEFEEFEIEVKSSMEDFDKWDDYMEWKAYKNSYNDLLKQREDLLNGDFKTA